MSSLFRVLALVCLVSLGSLAVTGCGSKAAAPDKMAAGEMGGDKMVGDKMGGDKMGSGKMADDKMAEEKNK